MTGKGPYQTPHPNNCWISFLKHAPKHKVWETWHQNQPKRMNYVNLFSSEIDNCKPHFISRHLTIQRNSSSKPISQVGKKDTLKDRFFSPWHWCGMSRPFVDVPNDRQICSKSQGTVATKGTWLKKISHSTRMGLEKWQLYYFCSGLSVQPKALQKRVKEMMSCVMFLFHLVFWCLTFRTDHRTEDQHNFGLKWCVYIWGTHIDAHST